MKSLNAKNKTRYFKQGQLPLKVQYIEFDFDVAVDIMQVLTDTSKSNLMLK